MSPTSHIGAEESRNSNSVGILATTGGGNTSVSSTYKEYGYSPVPVSSLASSVYRSTTLSTSVLPEEEEDDNSQRPKIIAADRKFSRTNNKIDFQFEMEETGSQILQYVAATAANMIILATGAAMGWTSPVSSLLKSNQTENPLSDGITQDQESWVIAFLSLGAVAGSLIAGFLAEQFGRKKTLLFSTVPYLIGWSLVATASNVEMLYGARIIFGIALAIDFTVVPMYCGEIAETSIRGVLGSFLQLFVTVGLLYSYAIGPYVTYTIFWILCAILPVIFFVFFLFMPESPYYLLSSGQKSEATDALARLRGISASGVQKELNEMQVAVDQAFSTEVKLTDLFTVKSNFKALMFTCAAVAFQQLTGINVVLFNAETIFKDTGSDIPPEVSTIIIGVVQMCASGVTPFIVDRMGRRTLLLLSGIGTALGTSALGLFFFMKNLGTDVSNLGWLPITSLVIFMCLYCIGWGPLPWAIMGEMFSAEVKAKASGITVLVCWALSFLITKYFNSISNNFGQHTSFWIFTVCCLLSIAFDILLLPETRGKSLKQIQEELSGVKSVDDDDREAVASQRKV